MARNSKAIPRTARTAKPAGPEGTQIPTQVQEYVEPVEAGKGDEGGDVEDQGDDLVESNPSDQDVDLNVPLDEDADTSLVGSIYLHLLGEHNQYEALRLSDDDAIALHQKMHREEGQHHPIADWRFRPSRALAASMLGCDTPAPADPPQ